MSLRNKIFDKTELQINPRNITRMDSKKDDLDKSTDDINRESQNYFEESGVERSESDKTEKPPSPEIYE